MKTGSATGVTIQTANPDQADDDGNGQGNACADTDEDGVLDSADNCPTPTVSRKIAMRILGRPLRQLSDVANPDQADEDRNLRRCRDLVNIEMQTWTVSQTPMITAP